MSNYKNIHEDEKQKEDKKDYWWRCSHHLIVSIRWLGTNKQIHAVRIDRKDSFFFFIGDPKKKKRGTVRQLISWTLVLFVLIPKIIFDQLSDSIS